VFEQPSVWPLKHLWGWVKKELAISGMSVISVHILPFYPDVSEVKDFFSNQIQVNISVTRWCNCIEGRNGTLKFGKRRAVIRQADSL